MKFDVYGRFFIEVTRESGRWIAHRIDQGRRSKMHELAIPGEAQADDIPRWLEDLLHEYALPNRTVTRIE